MNPFRKVLLWAGARLGGLRIARLIANVFELKKSANGDLGFPFVKRRRSASVQILVYHRVNDEYDAIFPGVPTRVFAEQMQYVAEHYSVCSLSEAVQRIRSNDLPANLVTITFDDGYRDNYLNAFPVLKRLSIPATIFLATDAIGSSRMLWHDRIFRAFRGTSAPILQSLDSNHLRSYPLRTLAEKLFAQREILKLLRSVNEAERSRLIDRLISLLCVEDRKEERGLMLSWDEVKEMHDSGMSFGSHSVTHPILSTLSIDRCKTEILGSKKTIEEKLRSPVKAFAYPNGGREDFNEDIKNLVRAAGYVCGLTTLFGANGEGQDLFELRRATPWDQQIASFGLRLAYYKFCG